MPAESEFVLLPNSSRFRKLSCPDLINEILDEWTSALASNRGGRDLDFDRLFGLGQIARQRGCADIEHAVDDFITKNVFLDAWDVISVFLMGYWRGLQRIEPGLVEVAVSALNRSDIPSIVRDQTVCALAAAWDAASQPLKSKILHSFRETYDTAYPELQDEAKRCITYVVGQKA
jgi:hypothetical protein